MKNLGRQKLRALRWFLGIENSVISLAKKLKKKFSFADSWSQMNRECGQTSAQQSSNFYNFDPLHIEMPINMSNLLISLVPYKEIKRWFLGIEDSVISLAKKLKKKSSASRIRDHRWIVSVATPLHDNLAIFTIFNPKFWQTKRWFFGIEESVISLAKKLKKKVQLHGFEITDESWAWPHLHTTI